MEQHKDRHRSGDAEPSGSRKSHFRRTVGMWCQARPGLLHIVLTVGFGLGLAIFSLVAIVDACFDAMQSWDTKNRLWKPGNSRAFFGIVHVSAEFCRDMEKSPPWLQLSGLAAAPAVLLTWYWRDKKRRADECVALQEREVANTQLRLNGEIAFAQRYTAAAGLLASADIMTRINGLESLFDIALQSGTQRPAVSRTLAAFVLVRTSQSRSFEGPKVTDGERSSAGRRAPPPAADVQAAMTLLGRSEWARGEWSREAAELNLRGAELMFFDLRGAALAAANLEGANLEWANLEGANLQRADLRNAQLAHAKLNLAQLADANLEAAHLEQAGLARAHLERARLSHAKLAGAYLGNAHLQGADLRCSYLEGAVLEDAQLQRADLGSIRASGARLSRAHLEDAHLVAADLQHADLKCAHLESATLSADLRGANLAGAFLQHANLGSSYLEGADLSGAQLEGATIWVSDDPRLAEIVNTKLKGAIYDKETRFPSGFAPEQLAMIRRDDQRAKAAVATDSVVSDRTSDENDASAADAPAASARPASS